MAQSKATKKFEKNRLKDTLKRRKDFAKVKQRNQVQAKKKARRAQDRAEELENLNGNKTNGVPTENGKKGNTLQDMSVDDFFAGAIDIPTHNRSAKRSGKRKRTRKEEQQEEDSDTSDASVASVEEHAALDQVDSDDEDELAAHKDDLKALAQKDPEFYKYLQENDAELLDPESAGLDEVDELSGDEDDNNSKKVDKGSAPSTDVTRAIVKRWSTSLKEKNSLRQVREVVLAFRAAAHLNEETDKTFKYTVSDADAYHDLLTLALKQVPGVVSHHIPVKEMPNGKVRVPTDSKKFKTLTILLKSHATSIQHLLDGLSDASTIRLTLNSILDLLPYLLTFKKLIRDLTRSVVDVWSDAAQTEATRVTAFLILRRLVVIGDAGIKEAVLKTAYQGLVKGTRSTTIHNVQGHNLMKNSATELWGLADGSVAYTTAFTFIRQLAIHLRNSIKNNANEAYKAVYNWQYVHSLDFWSRVLSTNCDILREATLGKESPLKPLIYPLTQVTFGAMRLIPTAAYFPLRLHTIRALIRLSKTTNTFIPLAAPLYEILTSSEMKKAPKPSTLKPLDFETSIRASKSLLHTRVYQDGVGEQVTELLSEFFVIWSKSVAFPELVLPVILMLKRWLKEVSPFVTQGGKKGKAGKKTDTGNRNGKLNSSINLLIQKLDANSTWISERRSNIEFCPNNRSGVESFLKDVEWTKTPLGAFVEGQRKVREEKRRLMEEGRREEEKKKAEERRERAAEMDLEMEHGGFIEKDVDEDADAAVADDDDLDEEDEDDSEIEGEDEDEDEEQFEFE